MRKLEQEAYDRLRETLGFSDAVDLYTVLYNANALIKRLQYTLNGKSQPITDPFPKRKPLKGETLCPFDNVPYNEVPNYKSGFGCPVCKAIGQYHLPIKKIKKT